MLQSQRGRLRAGMACCLVGLVLACDNDAGRGSQARAAATSEAVSAPQASEGAQALEPSLPPPRGVRVSVSERGYTVLANQASPRRVLRELGRTARVHVESGRLPPLPPVTLRLVGVPLERVLAELLPGVTFTLHFAQDAEGGGTLLSGISVGDASGPAGATTRIEAARARDAAEASRELPRLTPEEIERRREERLVRLADSDPEVRADEAKWIQPDGEGLEQLEHILEEDPDPEVRIAATSALSDGDSFGAVDTLLRALSDPDPRVVVAALEALEFAADESVIPRLQPVLEHPSVEVRQRAVEAIEFLGP